MSAFTDVEQGKNAGLAPVLGLAFAVVATLLLAMACLTASQASAAMVSNPGNSDIAAKSGFMKVGGMEQMDLSDGSLFLPSTISSQGNITVSKDSIGAPEFNLCEVDDGSCSAKGWIYVRIPEDATGYVDPITGEGWVRIYMWIRAEVTSPLGVNCNVGSASNPIGGSGPNGGILLKTGTSGALTGVPYSVGTGRMTVVNNEIALPSLSGDFLCSTLAGQFGLSTSDTSSGKNFLQFELEFDPAPVSTATININQKPSTPTNQKSAQFTYNTSVSSLDHECRIDGGAWAACPPGSPVNYSGLSDGQHTFQVRAVAGGSDVTDPSSVSSYTWTVDTVVPTYTINGAPTGLVNTRNANLSFTVSKTMPPGSARCSLDGATPTACTSPQNLTGLSDGSHSFTVSGTDAAGNVGSTTRSWTVDGTKPVVSIDSGPVGISSTADVNFTFTATDNMTANPAAQCQVRNRKDNSVVQSWTSCTSPYPQVRPTGKWQLQVRATDNAGNVSDVQNYDWQANTAEPVIIDDTFTFNGDPTTGHEGGTTSSDAAFEFEAATYELDDNDEPVAIEGTEFTYECWLDGEALGACESPMTLHDLNGGDPLTEGSHTFEVKPTTVASPSVGGARTAFEWKVDTVNPTASIADGPSLHNNSSTATFVLNVDGTGSQGTAECKLDNANWADCDSNTAHDVNVADGHHTLLLRAVDQAGNRSQAVSHEWNADTVDPSVSLFGTPAENAASNDASFSFETNDDDNNVQAICQLDNGTDVPCDSRTAHTFHDIADGVHTFTVTAKDRAGNTSSTDYEWRVDTTAPSLSINEGPAALTNESTAAFKFTGSDGGSGIDTITCRIDDGAWVSGSECQNGNIWNFYPGPFSTGVHKYTVRVKDNAGNTTDRSRNWTVDKTPADVAIATKPANSKDTTASIEFFSSEQSATFECKLDDGGFAPCSSPTELNGLSVGNHVFSVRSVDAAGNKSDDDSIAWKVLGDDPVDPTDPTCEDEGKVGTYPNCEEPKCPDGQVGTPPNCKEPEPTKCEEGFVGTPPNCKKLLDPIKPNGQVSSYDPTTGKLQLRLKCPGGFKPKCIGTAVAVTAKKGGKPMSGKVKNTSRAGKWKLVTITIKKAYRPTVEQMATVDKKQLVVKQTLRSKKKKKKTVFHTYKVRVKG